MHLHDPSAHPRVGIIDIGSNSIRLVVYDAFKRAPIPLYNEKVMCALGKGLAITGLLNPEGVQLAKPAIARFLAMARNMEVGELFIIATAAVREAKDGAEFVAWIEHKYQVKIEIISGKREARLGAHAIGASMHEPGGISCDLGGASMELAHLQGRDIGDQITLPLGHLRLTDQTGGNRDKMRTIIEKNLDEVVWLKHSKPEALYAIGGSFRTLAKMHMQEAHYPLHILHEYEVGAKAFAKFVRGIAEMPAEKIGLLPGASSKRTVSLPGAAMIVERLIELAKPQTIRFSGSGIREGYLFEMLDPRLREQDVLLSACTDFGRRRGKQPDYAHELFTWMSPLFPKESKARRRLRRAFCLLSEVSLHIHPEYRAAFAFERIVQSALTGLSHRERVTLALACYHRYQYKLKDDWPMLALLEEEDHDWARLVGTSANLAYHLSGGIAGSLSKTSIVTHKGEFSLTLSGNMHDIMGDAVRKRMDGLKELVRG